MLKEVITRDIHHNVVIVQAAAEHMKSVLVFVATP
jgi:hypothetical protein